MDGGAMSDDTPKPKPPIRPEPECANSPSDGEGVPAWQIVLMFAVIIGVAFAFAMAVGQ